MPQILIVDDSEADILFARRALASRTEWTVASAQDGEQALEMLETDSFDVVVSDIRMPRIDGLQLLRQIRQRFIEIPVIITTSHGSEEIAMQAIQAGAASYVPKSNVVRELLEVVESVISSSIVRKNQSRFLACVAQQALKIVLPNNDRKFISTVVSEIQSLATAIGLTNSSDNTQLGVALEESLVNAVVHGNLEVSSDLRQRNDDSYAELIEKRRNMEPYKDRVVTVTLSLTREEGQFTILDDGPGFDVNNLPDPTDPENLLKPSGRGIMLINAFMDEVSFNAKGNEIRLTKRRLPDEVPDDLI